VASSISHLCPYGISKVKIWNYNGSLNELNAGVREIRMFFGGELVWTGLIRKGCGNQAFDYCTVIDMEKRRESLTESNETHVVRSQTVILESPVGVKPENETQKSIDSPLAQKSTSSLHNRAMEDHLPETTNNLVRQSVNETPFWLQKASQQSESQATSAKKTPIWLRDSLSGRHSMSQPQLTAVRLSEQEKRRGSLGYNYREDDPLGLGTPFPRSNSEIRLVDSIDQPYTERSASVRSGRRAHSRKQLLDEESKQKSFSDSQLFSDSKNHDTEKVDSIGPLPGPITSMDAALSLMQVDTQKAGHAHTRSKWHTSTSLEKSLQSLEQFRMSDYGRITADLEISGDTLDMFMSQTLDEGSLLSVAMGRQAGDYDEAIDVKEFDIPELPSGQALTINILTTWGDRHYVGLNGIEIFSSSGQHVDVQQIEADPADINVLPEYDSDPRVVQNLVDGVNRTRDDLHMWLAPFTEGNNHTVHLEFTKPETIALIRIWNYNKSRIHSYRGARHVQMKLDDCIIFDGEIARACGGLLGGSEAFGDTILFTTDEDILAAVSEFDETFHGEMENFEDYYDDDKFNARPGTADTEQDESRPLTRIRMQSEETVLPVNVSPFPCGQCECCGLFLLQQKSGFVHQRFLCTKICS
jgi:hypothetical protein